MNQILYAGNSSSLQFTTLETLFEDKDHRNRLKSILAVTAKRKMQENFVTPQRCCNRAKSGSLRLSIALFCEYTKSNQLEVVNM